MWITQTGNCHPKGSCKYYFRRLWAQADPQPCKKGSEDLKIKIAQRICWLIAREMHSPLAFDERNPEDPFLCILEPMNLVLVQRQRAEIGGELPET